MKILEEIRSMIDQSEIIKMSDDEFRTYINNLLITFYNEKRYKYNQSEIKQWSNKIYYEYRGLGLIDELIEDDQINEIMINAHDLIFIEKSGQIYKSKEVLHSLEEYNRLIQKIVSQTGREVNLSNPIVDATIPSVGARINIVLPPIANGEPCVTIRKFTKENIRMNDLIKYGTLDTQAKDFLSDLIKAKYNIMIGGGTSSGKTTFLNALTEFIDSNERIVTIEDSRELKIIDSPNLISLETRNPNSSSRGQVTIKDLIKNSLRMRPDRIIVGEVRADESLDMLQAMNTGHDGSLSTVHANSTRDMISRLETMVLRASDQIPLEAVKRLISSSLEILIYLKRVSSEKRRLVEITEIVKKSDDQAQLHTIFAYDYATDRLVKVGNLKNKEKMERYKNEK